MTSEPTGHEAAGRLIGPQWLKQSAWPLWLEHGVDWKRRAFHEHLAADSLRCDAGFRRLRVAARQTYVFAKAAREGVAPARQAVALGVDFLQGPARLPDGGYAWRFDLDNRPVDRRRDLYDHAFVLLAFASAAPVLGADSVEPDAEALADFIAARFVHPGEGLEESIPPSRPRRQNPHMHLLEAMLAAHEAFGGDRFFAQATQLVELFLRRFFQLRDGALAEFFAEDLSPLREAGRYEVEPGHHYEWIWLLDWYDTAARAHGLPSSAGLRKASDDLLAFADRHAVSPHLDRAVDGLWSDGTMRQGSVRLWPQTERLKAEARRPHGAPERLSAALRALDKHVRDVHPGLWIERVDADGQALPGPVPATSLYHLTAALTDAAVVALCGASEAPPAPAHQTAIGG